GEDDHAACARRSPPSEEVPMPLRALLPPLALLLLPAPSPAAPAVWKAKRAGDWFEPANWEAGRAPAAGDDVRVGAGARVTLGRSTPELRSLTVSGALVFFGWDTRLSAGNLTVAPGG